MIEKVLNFIQLALMSLGLVCMLIAATTFIIGHRNMIHQSPYPSLILWVAILVYFIKIVGLKSTTKINHSYV